MKDGVGHTAILCFGSIKVIWNFPAVFVDHGYIFQHGICLDGTVYVGLCLFRQVNRFGIATALKIKNSLRVPPVLVITNQGAERICRKSCLAVISNI